MGFLSFALAGLIVSYMLSHAIERYRSSKLAAVAKSVELQINVDANFNLVQTFVFPQRPNTSVMLFIMSFIPIFKTSVGFQQYLCPAFRAGGHRLSGISGCPCRRNWVSQMYFWAANRYKVL